MASLIVLLLFVAGPLAALAIWLWLRSRRDPIALVEPLEIGRVFSLGFRVFTPQGWPVVGLSAILIGLPQLASVLVVQRDMALRVQAAALANPGNPFAVWQAMLTGPFLIGMLIGLVLMIAFYVAATLYLVSRFEGQPLAMGDVLARTPGRILPTFGATLLAYIAIVVGMCLFVLPGIVLALSWSVLIPVIACERVGFFSSFARSRSLAMGSRGRILLIMILLIVMVILLSLPAGGLMAVLNRQPRIAPSIFAMGWRVASGIVLAAFQASLFAGLYVELRRIRDGLSAPGLAAVFA